MHRSDFQKLAECRAGEAEALLQARCYSGAYYLAGYAIECALKACIAKKFRAKDIPEKGIVARIYTHDLDTLLDMGLVEEERNSFRKKNSPLGKNWEKVNDWSEESRYQWGISEAEAREIVAAIVRPQEGVLACLKRFW